MGYLVQKTRASQLTVGGVDYTSSFVSLQVSDVSAFKNGLMTTSGTLVLGQRPGGSDIEDYDRNIFKRGTVVILDITEPGGAAYRHPRGYLYVISVSYNVEVEQLEIAVGCRLALAFLTDDGYGHTGGPQLTDQRPGGEVVARGVDRIRFVRFDFGHNGAELTILNGIFIFIDNLDAVIGGLVLKSGRQ